MGDLIAQGILLVLCTIAAFGGYVLVTPKRKSVKGIQETKRKEAIDPHLKHSYQAIPVSNDGSDYQDMVEEAAERLLAKGDRPRVKLMKELAEEVIHRSDGHSSSFILDVMDAVSERSQKLTQISVQRDDS